MYDGWIEHSTDRQTDRKTDGHTNKHMDKQINKLMDRHFIINYYNYIIHTCIAFVKVFGVMHATQATINWLIQILTV